MFAVYDPEKAARATAAQAKAARGESLSAAERVELRYRVRPQDTDYYAFVDLDHCLDPETRGPSTAAAEVLARIRTYTEVSPSGDGLHLFLKGRVPPGSRRRGTYAGTKGEVYDRERFATVTGHHLEGTPGDVLEAQDGLEWLLLHLAAEPGRSNGNLHSAPLEAQWGPISPLDPTITDDDLLARIRRSAQGEKFRLLYDEGDYRAVNPAWSPSEAVQSLLCLLASWTRKDPQRMDRLFRESALYSEWADKWARRGEAEITHACSQVSWLYDGGVDTHGFVIVGDEDGHTSSTVIVSGRSAGRNDETKEITTGVRMAPEAYYGVLGRIARETEPYIEATSAPLLVNLILAGGIAMGREPYLQVGAQRHRGVLQSVTVARTGHNKTDAYAPIMTLWAAVKQHWERSSPALDFTGRDPSRPDPLVFGGLSTGEGLLYAIRDESLNKKGETVPGVADKRLLVVEPEFASVLKVMYRQDNILGVKLREVYDSADEMRNSPKGEPIVVTGAHIGLIGLITPTELGATLRPGEVGNGFVPRILWLVGRRVHDLPDPPDYTPLAQEHTQAWLAAWGRARQLRQVRWSAAAMRLWKDGQLYRQLRSDDGRRPGMRLRRGLAQDICSRAHVAVMRMALILTAYDGADEITEPVLRAALAVWDYCERSASVLFSGRERLPKIDRIVDALRERGRLAKSEITLQVFKGNIKVGELDTLLAALEQEGRIHRGREQDTGGRTAEWFELADEGGQEEAASAPGM